MIRVSEVGIWDSDPGLFDSRAYLLITLAVILASYITNNILMPVYFKAYLHLSVYVFNGLYLISVD